MMWLYLMVLLLSEKLFSLTWFYYIMGGISVSNKQFNSILKLLI